MFGIETERWFSLFKRGLELLGEMSTVTSLPEVLSVEKRTQGHGVPRKLGMASQSKWALRASHIGHCVPQKLGMASHSKWALRPGGTGHDVPVWSAENITQFGNSLVGTFFPHRCSSTLGRQAIAASDWIKESKHWRQCP